MKVWWRSGHLSARRSDLRKSLQTDRQTDGRTDDGRLAIVLAHSRNELIKPTDSLQTVLLKSKKTVNTINSSEMTNNLIM